QRRRLGAAGTSRLGGPLGALPAHLAHAHRSLHVRPAVCHQAAERRRRIGVNAMTGKTAKKSAKVAKKAVAGRRAANVAKPRNTAPTSHPGKTAKPALLAGGNPQIAKADGDAAVQSYIAAMPG